MQSITQRLINFSILFFVVYRSSASETKELRQDIDTYDSSLGYKTKKQESSRTILRADQDRFLDNFLQDSSTEELTSSISTETIPKIRKKPTRQTRLISTSKEINKKMKPSKRLIKNETDTTVSSKRLLLHTADNSDQKGLYYKLVDHILGRRENYLPPSLPASTVPEAMTITPKVLGKIVDASRNAVDAITSDLLTMTRVQDHPSVLELTLDKLWRIPTIAEDLLLWPVKQ